MPLQLLSLRNQQSCNFGSSLESYNVPYEAAYAFQKKCVEERIRDEIPDTFLFVEHPPVITRGRGLQRTAHSPDGPRAVALPEGLRTPYFEVERGGDLTAHEPGQLVIYPIVKLDTSGEYFPHKDIDRYLRKLEKDLGLVLEEFGVHTMSQPDATGVWVGQNPEKSRKIASIGIAIRKWVTFHGIGLNVSNDLKTFQDISPCGFNPDKMTTLVRESPAFSTHSWSQLREKVEKSWGRCLNAPVEHRIVEISTNIR